MNYIWPKYIILFCWSVDEKKGIEWIYISAFFFLKMVKNRSKDDLINKKLPPFLNAVLDCEIKTKYIVNFL